MKYYFYLIIEAIISIMIAALFVLAWMKYKSLTLILFPPVLLVYFFPTIKRSIALCIDLIQGVREENIAILGGLKSKNLDFFRNISYNIIYLDSEKMSKNFIIFDDVNYTHLSAKQNYIIKYYRLSRIIVDIRKLQLDAENVVSE